MLPSTLSGWPSLSAVLCCFLASFTTGLLLLVTAVASESVDDSLGTQGFETALLLGVDDDGFLMADWAAFLGWALLLDGVDVDNDGLAFLSGVPLNESESESSLSDDV